MGRNRTFNEAEVVAHAAAAFCSTGYEGTGVDELLTAVGLHRGSLYKAFGSKRGLFVAALNSALEADPLGPDELDLALVAALELAVRDSEVRDVLARLLDRIDDPAHCLGVRLLERAGINLTDNQSTGKGEIR